MRALVIAEHDDVSLRPGSLASLAFAQMVARSQGGDASWLVLGHGTKEVVGEAARFAPVLSVDSPGLSEPMAEPFARALAGVVRSGGFDLVTAASSTFAKDILPRAAAMLGGAMASDVVRHEFVDGCLLLDCPRYAGAVTATITLHGTPQVVTVRASSYGAANPAPAICEVQRLELAPATFARRGRYEGLQSKENSRPDVTEARVVVSGGRAFKNAEDFERHVGGLADALGGAAGSSRALVDAGIAPNELQVGQTGKIVAPEVYIALGISGAVQHLAGMKNSRTIVAINSDPDAPIFDVADYGLVGDVYQIVPQLIQKLERHASSAAR
jgi:electron transfer flavoprotein alpha subunit